KHDGTLPIIGVNTFLAPEVEEGEARHETMELARATEGEKESQLQRVKEFRQTHADESMAAIARLKEAATSDANVFAVLMDAARVCTLGQITEAFFEVGGQYRRNV
ncbi:MAG TPA: methylmalonyl-CoA mutase, partial [Marmoricola sp.]|nr:methylmalonyl-CoA mutase [Marmoricola sp.]